MPRSAGYLSRLPRLYRLLDGDLLYAVKPMLPNFLPAIAASRARRRVLLLDIDDLQLGWSSDHSGKAHLTPQQLLRARRAVFDPLANTSAAVAEQLIRFSDAVTTVSDSLRERFGGTIVPHCKDTDELNPDRVDRASARLKLSSEFDLDPAQRWVVFVGTPHPHKGLRTIIEAVHLVDQTSLLVVGGGSNSNPSFDRELVELGRGRVKLLPAQPVPRIPEFMALADAVPIVQAGSIVGEHQLPSKLFDAMAMARPIVVSSAQPLMRAVGAHTLGPPMGDGAAYVVPPDDPRALAEAFDWIQRHPDQVAAMGQRARQRCVLQFSFAAGAAMLEDVIAEGSARAARRGVRYQRTSLQASTGA
jgi:glycosyltransferase involved in cell wall biosynthesis